jgi:hypothetical protein
VSAPDDHAVFARALLHCRYSDASTAKLFHHTSIPVHDVMYYDVKDCNEMKCMWMFASVQISSTLLSYACTACFNPLRVAMHIGNECTCAALIHRDEDSHSWHPIGCSIVFPDG